MAFEQLFNFQFWYLYSGPHLTSISVAIQMKLDNDMVNPAQGLVIILVLIQQMHTRMNGIRANSLVKGGYSLCVHVNKHGMIQIAIHNLYSYRDRPRFMIKVSRR